MELIKKALQICKEKEKEKQYSELETISDQVLKVDPTNLPAKYFLALSKKKLNKEEEYLEIFKQIKSTDVEDLETNIALGSMCCDLEEIEQSLFFHKKAIRINPKNHDAWAKLGNYYRITKQYKKSIRCLKKSYKLNNKNEEVLVNLSSAYVSLRKINQTARCLKKAIKINKKSNLAKFNLGCCFLMKNNYRKGWKYYQHRFENFSYFEKMPKEKMLIGKKISNEKILFLVEQGIGDIINFVRFIKIFKQRFPNCEIKLLIDKIYTESFINFIKKNSDVVVIDKLNDDDDYNYWCSIIDIPQYLKMDKKEIINSYSPYLKTDQTCDYSYFNKMFKIGVCWAGNVGHPRDEERSCHLSLFKEIYNVPNVKLFSLQKDLRLRVWPFKKNPVDLSDCSDIRLINMKEHMNSWENTAAIISGLDLIISVDTSILHLAGALGKKTCGLLQYSPDWRWGIKSNKSIWYPNTTLFRQKKLGDWESVFSELNKYVSDCVSLSN